MPKARKHQVMDRREAADKFRRTARFVCFDCRFSTDSEEKAAAHPGWIEEQQRNRKEARS